MSYSKWGDMSGEICPWESKCPAFLLCIWPFIDATIACQCDLCIDFFKCVVLGHCILYKRAIHSLEYMVYLL